MINFLTRHPEKIYVPLLEHIELVFMTLLISVAIASVLTLLCMRSERLSMWLQQLLGVVYSIPSLALFAILIPVTGLGRTTAVIALTAYNQYLLLRNCTTGGERHRDDLAAGPHKGADSAGKKGPFCRDPAGSRLHDRDRYNCRFHQCRRIGDPFI